MAAPRIVPTSVLVGRQGPDGPDGPQGPPGPGTGAGAWVALTAYTANQVVQAPDGTLIYRLSSGTSRASFDGTEAALWAANSSRVGTIEQAAQSASTAAIAGRGINVKSAPYNAVGDGVANDTAALQAAFDAAGAGGTVFLPSDSGETYLLTGTVNVTNPEVTLLSNRNDYGPTLRKTTAGAILNVSSYQFRAVGVAFEGGVNPVTTPFASTTDGVVLDRTGSGSPAADLDARFVDCSFSLMRRGISATGRNLDVFDCLFSQLATGIRVAAYTAEECRGFTLARNRFHSVGLASDIDFSAVEPACIEFTSNEAFGIQVTGNHADSACRIFYKGPLDRTHVNDNLMYRMNGSGIVVLVPAGGSFWQAWEVCNNTYEGNYDGGIDGTELAALESTPDHFLQALDGLANGLIGGNVVSRTRKHGMTAPGLYNTVVSDNVWTAVGSYAAIEAVVYDAINVGEGDGCLVTTNRIRAAGTSSHRYAINMGTSTSGKVFHNYPSDSATADYNLNSLVVDIDTPLWRLVGTHDSTAFANSWVNESGEEPAAYCKVNGRKYLRGMIKNGTVGGGAEVFTLPAGARPTGDDGGSYFPCNANDAFASVHVLANGQVRVRAGSSTWLDLASISFY